MFKKLRLFIARLFIGSLPAVFNVNFSITETGKGCIIDPTVEVDNISYLNTRRKFTVNINRR